LLRGPVGSHVAKKSPYIWDLKCALLCSWQLLHAPTQSHLNPLHHLNSHFESTLILSSQLQQCLRSCLFPYSFPTKTQYAFPSTPTPRVPCTSHSSWFHHPNHWSLQTKKPHVIQFLLHTIKQQLPLLVTQVVSTLLGPVLGQFPRAQKKNGGCNFAPPQKVGHKGQLPIF